MTTTETSWISSKLSDACIGLDTPDEQARAVIYAAVGISTAMGAVPFGINMATFVAVDTTMVATVGAIYGYTYTPEQVGELISRILKSATMSTGVYLLAAKLFAEGTKVAGTAVTPLYFLGMSTDMVVAAAVTYAIGFTAKNYFERDELMSRGDMQRAFRHNLKDGRRRGRTD